MDSADNEGTVSEDQTSGFNTRQRILTEKGFQYQLGQKEQRFRGIISKWRKHVLKIECLLSERSNVVDIKAERDVLLETMADLSNVYNEVDNLLSTVDQMGGNNDQPTATRANLGNLTNDFLYQVSLNRLPVPEPEIFSGDPLQYPGWKCAIDLLLENKGIPPSEKIYYLKRYLSGPPKDALEGYFLVPSDSTYIEVRKLLDDRYGNNLAIADAFRSKLEGWPNIQPNDGLALRKFADFLGQCEFAMKLVKGRLSFLNDSCLIGWLVKRWGRVLSEWDDFPPFGKFRQFIAKEADIACNPLIVSSQKGKGSRGTRGASNFVVETGFDNSSTKLNAHRYKCLICEGDHRLDCCYKFLAKTVEDRTIFVKTKHLCYGCLRQGHISKFCRNRLVCNICSRSHPTALRGDIVSHIGKTVVPVSQLEFKQKQLTQD
ncbi:hypothetical protein BSL78_19919 [Apostichopus japonicus]|uniref:CCHC-type domain-containing protein n=1 Tax=Stichopus japonicus TaxID=307972 RepID=A0A2G8K5E9_STIJA|nr:hypothetical protein BSL78_19919 [Apostichopus japonicus]